MCLANDEKNENVWKALDEIFNCLEKMWLINNWAEYWEGR